MANRRMSYVPSTRGWTTRRPIRGRQPRGASREMPGRTGPSFEALEHFRGASPSNPPFVVDVFVSDGCECRELIRHCSGTQAILVHQGGHRAPLRLLAELRALRESGAISAAEFEMRKSAIGCDI
jgi:hypothetical protein